MTRKERKAVSRAALLAAAKRLFETEGYSAVTVRTLSKAAGYSTGAFFQHWPGKEQLWREATGLPTPDEALEIYKRSLAAAPSPPLNEKEAA